MGRSRERGFPAGEVELPVPCAHWAAGLAAALLLTGSCCRSAREPGALPGGQAATGKSNAGGPPWSVRIGSQGGFTGGGSGYLLRSDGAVLAWSRITPQDSLTTQTAGVASPESLLVLHGALASLAASNTVFERTGNMTVFLEWIEAPAPRRWSWPEGAAADKIPAPVDRAYRAALAAVAGARPHAESK